MSNYTFRGMSNYTSGPWVVKRAEDLMGRQLDGLVKWVVTAFDGDLWISTGPTWDSEHWQESEGNAKLIAAAPAMLDALISCANFLECIEGISRNNMEQLASEELDKVVRVLEQAVWPWEGNSADS
jgi:hypothetical protein